MDAVPNGYNLIHENAKRMRLKLLSKTRFMTTFVTRQCFSTYSSVLDCVLQVVTMTSSH